jgi:hypothetical protein
MFGVGGAGLGATVGGMAGAKKGVQMQEKTALKRAQKQIVRLKDIDSAMLVMGEVGVGKKLFARIVHNEGKRGLAPFATISCKGVDEATLSAQLFGNETQKSKLEECVNGTILIDEIGFIRDLKDLWEAMEPIASRQKDFRVVMATTPPSDDGHYSYEMIVPPEGWEKKAHDPKGHWYKSQANIMVHRTDVYDAYEAGLDLYDLNTREPITPEESRAKALDRDAWDRNYALIATRGGICALSLLSLKRAMDIGAENRCLASINDFPPNWRDFIGDGPVAIGVDPATTTKEKSNPTGLVIMEKVGTLYIPRLHMRYKSSDPDEHRVFIKEAVEGVVHRKSGRRIPPRALCLDASNERLFAADLRKELSGICPVYLMVSSEKTSYAGESMLIKEYLGNSYVNAISDGSIPLPNERWVKDDYRLVVKERGSFCNRVDSAGNHADTFDGGKLAYHGLNAQACSSEAHATQVGSYPTDSCKPKSFWTPDHSEDHAPKTQESPSYC